MPDAKIAGMTVEEIRAEFKEGAKWFREDTVIVTGEFGLALCDEVERLRNVIVDVTTERDMEEAYRKGRDAEIITLRALVKKAQGMLDHSQDKREEHLDTLDERDAQIQRLKDQGWKDVGRITVLEKALRDVEWSGDVHGPREPCPECLHDETMGHASDCALAAALSPETTDTETEET